MWRKVEAQELQRLDAAARQLAAAFPEFEEQIVDVVASPPRTGESINSIGRQYTAQRAAMFPTAYRPVWGTLGSPDRRSTAEGPVYVDSVRDALRRTAADPPPQGYSSPDSRWQ